MLFLLNASKNSSKHWLRTRGRQGHKSFLCLSYLSGFGAEISLKEKEEKATLLHNG